MFLFKATIIDESTGKMCDIEFDAETLQDIFEELEAQAVDAHWTPPVKLIKEIE